MISGTHVKSFGPVHPHNRDGSLVSLGASCAIVGGAYPDRRTRGDDRLSDRVTELDGDELRTRKPFPTKCATPGLALLPHGVIACGGKTEDGATAATYTWELGANPWRPGPRMVAARIAPRVVPQPNGRVVVIGGVPRGAPVHAEQLVPAEFVPIDVAFGQLVPQDCPLQPVLACLLTSGEVLVADAVAIRELGADLVPCVRITLDGTTRPTADAPASEPMALVALPDGGAFLVETSGQTTIYDERADAWRPGPALGACGRASACALRDGRVLVVGGDGADPDTRMVIIRDTITLVDPMRGTASVVGRLRHARRCPQLALAGDDVAIFGGVVFGDEDAELTIERWAR